MPNQGRHDHDTERVECRECGSEFDLSRQDYYADLCPACRVELEDGAGA